MGIEIERKFLVKNDAYRQQAHSKTLYKQGYLKASGASVVRVRTSGSRAFITVKGQSEGIARSEFEYEIPVADANDILQLCEGHSIEKYRYIIPCENGLKWEVDEFLGANAGLVIAEIELPNANQPFVKPDWLGNEVSDDERYYNAFLSQHPYNEW